jgi:hypothetical protein
LIGFHLVEAAGLQAAAVDNLSGDKQGSLSAAGLARKWLRLGVECLSRGNSRKKDQDGARQICGHLRAW